jgi:hypothetical protein
MAEKKTWLDREETERLVEGSYNGFFDLLRALERDASAPGADALAIRRRLLGLRAAGRTVEHELAAIDARSRVVVPMVRWRSTDAFFEAMRQVNETVADSNRVLASVAARVLGDTPRQERQLQLELDAALDDFIKTETASLAAPTLATAAPPPSSSSSHPINDE